MIRLEKECDDFSGSTDEETALLERVKAQHELLDTERKVSIKINWQRLNFWFDYHWSRSLFWNLELGKRSTDCTVVMLLKSNQFLVDNFESEDDSKVVGVNWFELMKSQVFEDLEFQLMEGVAHQEAEREELHKEMANLEMRLLQRRQQVKEVEQQQRQAAETAKSEAQDLSNKRQRLFQQIDQVLLLYWTPSRSNKRKPIHRSWIAVRSISKLGRISTGFNYSWQRVEPKILGWKLSPVVFYH